MMTLSAQEFLRRFLLHVLPRGFVRIRSFGFLANRCRATLLPRCQRLLLDNPRPPALSPVPYTPLHRHASVVRNVPPRCCQWNFFLHGKLANSFPGVLTLTLPNPQPMPLSIAQSSTPTAFVSLLTPTDSHIALTSTPNPRSDTSQHLRETQPSSLTPTSCAIQRRKVFESPKQNP
jgi:hypothetical protein